jgi:hypothetical protein
MPMATKGYKFAVGWIAVEDEPTDLDPESVKYMISVCLVADLFGKNVEAVANDVIKVRKTFAALDVCPNLGNVDRLLGKG